MQENANNESSTLRLAKAALTETSYQFGASLIVTLVSLFALTGGFSRESELKQFFDSITSLLLTNHWWTIASVIFIVGIVTVLQRRLPPGSAPSQFLSRLLVHVSNEAPRMVVQLGAAFTVYCLVVMYKYLDSGEALKSFGAFYVAFVVVALCLATGWLCNFMLAPERR
jgi:hypothetical protein